MMVTLAVLTGVSFTLWVTTTAGVAFVLYHFVYKSWKVMRTDMKALAAQVSEALTLIQRERVLSLTDEEVAFREKRLQAKQRERVAGR